jgi:hypothetical protein
VADIPLLRSSPFPDPLFQNQLSGDSKKNDESIDPLQNNNYLVRVRCFGWAC